MVGRYSLVNVWETLVQMHRWWLEDCLISEVSVTEVKQIKYLGRQHLWTKVPRWLSDTVAWYHKDTLTAVTSFHWFPCSPLIRKTISCQSALCGLCVEESRVWSQQVNTSEHNPWWNMRHQDKKTWLLYTSDNIFFCSFCFPFVLFSMIPLKVCVIVDVYLLNARITRIISFFKVGGLQRHIAVINYLDYVNVLNKYNTLTTAGKSGVRTWNESSTYKNRIRASQV